MKYYALTFENGLTYYVKAESILAALTPAQKLCGKLVQARKITEKEYNWRLKHGRS